MILGIETSCDETSVALIDADGSVRANLVSSQIERHKPFGGVVPEIASREHLQTLFPLLREGLHAAGATWNDVEAIAVTTGPGLIGALLVGVAGAQGLAYGLGIPLIAVNHLEGHIFSPYLSVEGESIALPARLLCIVISGGHSSIYDLATIEGSTTITRMNRTRDDAIGETFDKVAKFIGLPYPGGPEIERNARSGRIDTKRFPFSMAHFKEASTDFSFSGIKTAAIRLARQHEVHADGDPSTLSDFCATFQNALLAQLFDRLDTLWEAAGQPRPAEVAIAGGVAANGVLREQLLAWCAKRGVIARIPDRRYCTDNAAMIAFAALRHGKAEPDPTRVVARSRIARESAKPSFPRPV